ncbi:sugar-binding protein [Microbacterium sp. ZW T5_45]|uniref:sugar-binding protein n=1 Tax=Microbacterium sp. ZW T5_45 TaxID=3378080 RepID=UPI003854E62D
MPIRRFLASAIVGALGAAILVSTQTIAHADITESDSFEGWTTTVSGAPDFVIAADETYAHDGSASARIDYRTDYANSYVDLRQSIRANGGTTYDMSAWVRTEDLSSADSAYVVLSGDHSQRVEFPPGTAEWTRLEWTYTQPAGSMSFVMRLLVRGAGTVWIDDVRMVAQGTDADLVINGSFEEHDPPPGTLAFADTALVQTAGSAGVAVSTLASSVDWEVRASSGQRVDSGQASVVANRADIDLSTLPVGNYRVLLSIDAPVAVSRSSSLAVVSADPVAPEDSRVGVAVHVNRYTVDQVDALMAPLGVGTLREGPSWDTVETSLGVYEFPALFDAQIAAAVDRGERPLVILAYGSRWYDGGKTPSSPEGIQAFANYAAATAAHFGADVDYEIYNEFNHSFNTGACGTTAACYEQLLEPAAAAIHATAPGARVVGPVLAGADWEFFEELFALGGLEHLDAVSYHTYDFPIGPEGRTEAGVARLRALIDEYAPGAHTPIWLTEHGWPTTTGGTTEGEQAAYYLRSAALLEAAGVDRVVFYELIDSGANPAENEHNFGMVSRASDGGVALGPKLGYSALASYTRLTSGLTLTSLDRGQDGLIVATFSGDSPEDTVRMLWASDGTTVARVDVGSAAKLVDIEGRSWRVRPNGPLELHLTGDPVFVVGDSGAVVVTASPAVDVVTPAEVALGTAPDIAATVDRAALDVVDVLGIAGPIGPAEPLVTEAGSSSGTLALAPLRDVGDVPLSYTIREGDGVVAYVDATTSVVKSPILSLRPIVDDDGELVQAISARALPGASAATLTGLTWRIGAQQGSLDDAIVPSGESRSLMVGDAGMTPWQQTDYSLSVDVDGEPRVLSGTTVSAPVAPNPESADPVSMTEHGRYVALAGAQPESSDLDAVFALSWSDEGLRIHAEVEDEEHVPSDTVERLWSGDSVQFAVAAGLPGESPRSRVEFGARLGAQGAADVHRYTAPVGPDAGVTADIGRESTTTTYDILASWDALGIDPTAGAFSFSLLVNDNDGGVRQGFLEWGSGIGPSKDAALFLPVVLMPEPASLTMISVDGDDLGDFDPASTSYRAAALAGGPTPVISAVASDGVRVDVVQAPGAPGTAVVTASAPGRASTVYRIDLDRIVGDDAEVTASAVAICVDGIAAWDVTVSNTGEYASDVRATTAQADARRAALPAGGSTVLHLPAAAVTAEAGTARIAAYVPFAHPDRPASYLEFRVPLPAVDCAP